KNALPSPIPVALVQVTGYFFDVLPVVADALEQLRRQNEWLGRNTPQLKKRQQLIDADRSNSLEPTARPGEQPEQCLGGDSGVTQRCQTRITVPFRQTTPVGTDDQRHMGKTRRRQSECAIE